MKVRHYKRWVIKQEGDEYHIYRKVYDINREEPVAITRSYEDAQKAVDNRLYRFNVVDVLNGEILVSSPMFETVSDAVAAANALISKQGIIKKVLKDVMNRHSVRVYISIGPQPEYDDFASSVVDNVYSYERDNTNQFVFTSVYIDHNKKIIGIGDGFIGDFTYKVDTYIPVNKYIIGYPFRIIDEMS